MSLLRGNSALKMMGKLFGSANAGGEDHLEHYESDCDAKLIFQLALRYADAKKIHLVLDNLNIHRRKSLTDALGAEVGAEVWSRFTVHYTPRHGSWLNQAEIEIGLFARQCLGKRRMPNLQHLQRESKAWNRRMNRDKVTIDWRFTRTKARNIFRYHRNSFTRS